jgi:hypothetical protein
MPALLARADKFLQANANELNSRPRPSSKKFVWKWITMADNIGLLDAAMACIDAKITDDTLCHGGSWLHERCAAGAVACCLRQAGCYLAEALARQQVSRQQNHSVNHVAVGSRGRGHR